jgi:hypothetical protein
MARDRRRELVGMISKYAVPGVDVSSSSLRSDFRKVAKGVSREAMAWALAKVIVSPQTPSFPDILRELYQHSSKQARAELLQRVLSATPEFGNVLFDQAEQAPYVTMTPRFADKISLGKIEELAGAIESSKPAIDIVADFYAQYLTAVLGLPPHMLQPMLTYLARRGRIGIARPPRGIESEAVKRLRGARDQTICAFLGPPQPEPAVAAPADPAPEPRYASVQVFRESAPNVPGPELGKDQPFKNGQMYQFELSIRTEAVGIPAKARRPFREPRQSAAVDLIITADSDDFEILQPVSKLSLPPKGDSKPQIYPFRAVPKRYSVSASDLLRIRFQLFYKLNLLESITVQGEAVSSLDDDASSRFGRSPAVELCHERLRQSDFNDFDLMIPSGMHIKIEPRNLEYRLTLTVQVEDQDKLVLVAPISLTPAQLNSTIAGIRKSLLKVSSSDTFAAQVDGIDWEYNDHLLDLSDRGGKLWSLLFDQKQNLAISVIGDWLKDNPLPDGSKIQISVEEGASTFVFAWGLLYDRPISNGTARSVSGFWGYRYIIEQRLIMPEPSELLAPPQSDFEIGAMYWNFVQAPGQQIFVTDLLNKTSKPVRLAGGAPIDRADGALDYLRKCKSQVVYFYTHGYTGLPDGANFGVTLQDFVELYEKLPKKSVTRREWSSIYKQIKARQYNSDESWIELTFGRLELQRLYTQVAELPTRPLVLLNICDSAQVTPALKQSFIDFFLRRRACAVVGTECSVRPIFADFVGRELLPELLRGKPIGEALLRTRQKAAKRKNLMGLGYTLFGAAEATPWPKLLPDIRPPA